MDIHIEWRIPDELVDAAFTPPTRSAQPTSIPARYAIISVDPAPSCRGIYAIASAVYIGDGSMLIVGMASRSVGSIDECQQMFVSHAAALRERLKDVHVYLAVEATGSIDIPRCHEPWMIEAGYHVSQFTLVCGVCTSSSGHEPGVWMTKAAYRHAMGEFMDNMEKRRIHLARNVFSAHGHDSNAPNRAREQLKSFGDKPDVDALILNLAVSQVMWDVAAINMFFGTGGPLEYPYSRLAVAGSILD